DEPLPARSSAAPIANTPQVTSSQVAGEVSLPGAARSPRRGWSLMVAVGILVVVLGGWIMTRGVAVTPPRSPTNARPQAAHGVASAPAQAPLAAMRLEATPTRANAVIGGEIHALPLSLERPFGTQLRLLVENVGYEPQTIELRFDEPHAVTHVYLLP